VDVGEVSDGRAVYRLVPRSQQSDLGQLCGYRLSREIGYKFSIICYCSYRSVRKSDAAQNNKARAMCVFFIQDHTSSHVKLQLNNIK
jgi:hypothetical protein